MFSQSANAYQTESYAKPTLVQIHNQSSNTLVLNGLYKVTDKETLEEFFVTSKGPVALILANNEITLTHLGISINSSTGYIIEELKGSEQVAVFVSDTIARKSAVDTSEQAAVYQKLQGVTYIGSHTNSLGELWYNVKDSLGITSWVPSTSAVLESIPALPLGKLATGNQYRGSFEINKLTSTIQTVNRLDIEQYLKGVVASEMPSSWHLEALKSQAIAARGYAVKSKGILNSTTSSQVYKGYLHERTSTNTAIEQTKGKVVTYNGKLAETYFYSTSGGRTANVGDVWNSVQANFPYLVSVDDSTEVSPYSNWTVSIPASSILATFGFTPLSMLQDVKLIKGGANGEVTAVTVVTNMGEKTIQGNEAIMRGLFKNPANNNASLNSNWYDVSFTKPIGLTQFFIQQESTITPISSLLGYSVQTETGTVTITNENVLIQTNSGIISAGITSGITSVTIKGKGYGHRIGMSQYGAKAKAEAGWNAEQILKHYYPGTVLGSY
ncbi:SpoIID/LytB domain-containing protein [Paenisporosarcina sp. NPDC076898]